LSKKRIIVGITGASGAVYGIRILEILRDIEDIETHLIVSKFAQITIKEETKFSFEEICELADYNHKYNDLAASISSGSFLTEGMIVSPCSMKTLAEISSGLSLGLISRAADVVLKEKRKLVLLTRESPFSSIHLENMLKLSNMGAFIVPPVPAFYNKPETIDDIVNHTVGRTLDIFDIDSGIVKRWG
jgi:4-hydroxy-3-polyprenylbenzoate decarboxylase